MDRDVSQSYSVDADRRPRTNLRARGEPISHAKYHSQADLTRSPDVRASAPAGMGGESSGLRDEDVQQLLAKLRAQADHFRNLS